VEVLRQETPDFISPDLWPTNSPDLNPVVYQIWAVMHQRGVYQRKIHTIDELKQMLIEVWCGLEQSTVDMAVELLISGATKLSYGGIFFILVMSHFFLIPTLKEF